MTKTDKLIRIQSCGPLVLFNPNQHGLLFANPVWGGGLRPSRVHTLGSKKFQFFWHTLKLHINIGLH